MLKLSTEKLFAKTYLCNNVIALIKTLNDVSAGKQKVFLKMLQNKKVTVNQ